MKVAPFRSLWPLVLLIVAAPLAAQAEAEARPRAGIGGVVLDAGTSLPIEGATVVLQPEVIGAFPAGPASGSAFAATSRTVETGVTGTYRFENLVWGVYRIYVSRIGYRPYSIAVELRAGSGAMVGIALNAEPVLLEPLGTVALRRNPYDTGGASGDGVDLARLLAADQRRHRFLTTDARELTQADVIEAVTLGEPDVMRALQRLPGVSTRSDYTAELWTRGAPWAHTRVFYDGIPLFNPLHALGVVSGIGSSAIGAVWFHPGTRSASIGEGAAGVVDLQSRRAEGEGELNAHADLSLLSASLAVDQRVLDGRVGWMLAGRRTYLDWMSKLARNASSRDDLAFPYGFAEVAGRIDAWLGEATSVEASFLWEKDHLTSVQPQHADRLRAEWGNAAGRVSLNSRLGGLHLRHTAGISRHDGLVLPDNVTATDIPIPVATSKESDTGVEYRGVSGTVWPEPKSLAGPSWSLGYGYEEQRVGYFGPQVLPVPRFSVETTLLDDVRVGWSSRLRIASLWGERAWEFQDGLSLRAGLRLEGGDDVAGSEGVRWAPRLAARFTPIPEVALSAGLARVFQYTQVVAPGGMYVASLATTDVWLLAGPEVPALRSDIATLGLETWLAPGRVASLNAFTRHAVDVATADPRPGRLGDRPAWVLGENVATGLEFSMRQITGPLTGSASYTWSRSEMEAAGMRYAAPADRRHVLSTTAMVRTTDALRVGGAFTAASGVPFTRTIADPDECAAHPGCDPTRLPWLAEPTAARAPTYASLDLLIDWTGRVGRLDVGVYAQLRNVLGRENATIYTADEPGCHLLGCAGQLRSEYERGVPRLPVIGVRVRY